MKPEMTKKRLSGLAVAVFVLALVSYCCLPIAPVAALLGLIAWVRFRGNAGRRLRGNWMATAGFFGSLVLSLLIAGGSLWLAREWPRLVCNRRLAAIGKAIKEYKGDFYTDTAEDPDPLMRLVTTGLLTEDQTRCPAATDRARFVLLPRSRMEATGVIAHDTGPHHHGERGVLHQEETIHTGPTRTSSTGDGGMRYEYEYVVLWIADPMPEGRFERIMEQKSPDEGNGDTRSGEGW